MVDPDAGDLTAVQQADDHAVAVGEHLRLLHAQADQVVDREEAAIVELFLGGSPVRKTVMLTLQHVVERVGIMRHVVHVLGVEGARRKRKCEIVIADDDLVPLALERQRAILELVAEAVTEHSEQDLVLQRRRREPPVDVEVVRIPARLAVHQQVPPPQVDSPCRGHVVGHDVDEELDRAFAHRLSHPPKAGVAAEL